MKEKEKLKYELLKQKMKEQSIIVKNLLENHPMQILWVSRLKASELYDVSCRTINNWKREGKLLTKTINDKLYYSIQPLIEN